MDTGLDLLRKRGLPDRLNGQVVEWSKSLPSNLSLPAPEAFFSTSAPNEEPPPSIQAVRSKLVAGIAPTLEEWTEALEAQRTMVADRVVAGDAAPFFTAPQVDARPHLQKLAQRFFGVCAKDDATFQVSALTALHEQPAQLRTALRETLDGLVVREAADRTNDFLARDLDLARDWLRNGNVPAALALLERTGSLAREKGGSVQLLFGIETCLGACSLEMQKLSDAAEHLRRAQALLPDEIRGLTNLALVQLQLQAPHEALALLRRAVSLAPRDGRAMAYFLAALAVTGAEPEAMRLGQSESWIGESTECIVQIAGIHARASRFDEAEQVLHAGIGAGEDSEVRLALAQVLAERASRQLAADPPLRWSIPEPARSQLLEADELLTRLLGDAKYSTMRRSALVTRSSVRGYLNRIAEALADAKEAQSLPGGSKEARVHEALALVNLNEWASAIPPLLELFRSDHEPEIGLLLGRAYVHAGERTSALAHLRAIRTSSAETELEVEICALLLQLLLEIGDPQVEVDGLMHFLEAHSGVFKIVVAPTRFMPLDPPAVSAASHRLG